MKISLTIPFKRLLPQLLFLLLLAVISNTARADHITGGEMFYTSQPGANGTILYFVTLKLFMRCNSGRQFNNPAIVSIFNRGTNSRVSNINVALTSQQTIQLANAGPCVTNPPTVCYVIGTYSFNVSLNPSTTGYVIASQVNFRIAGISNLITGYSNVGALYTCEIPGTDPLPNSVVNNSARFTASDLVVVCANNKFSYSFAATDPDGDELRYSFCNAFVSGGASFSNNNIPPPVPPFQGVPYGAGFTGFTPLGPDVSINNRTGLITGTAPPTGIYVVTVCVQEVRNGIVIATQRKDLQINIAACDIAAAVLLPEYQLCRTSRTLAIDNLSTSNLINSQNWEVRNMANNKIFDIDTKSLNYTFTDTGLYSVRLVINRGQACSDSSNALVRVYPGFKPDFTYAGICFSRPTLFTNTSTTVYGAIQSVSWTFGDGNQAGNTSTQNNPTYTFTVPGTKNTVLNATNTNGCKDTVSKLVPIFTRPPLNLAFTDTLICQGDSVQLRANGTGNYTWSPGNAVIANANTPTPTVAPLTSTKYYVNLNDQGCLNRDSVLVRVTDKVALIIMGDTTICTGDSLQLRITTDGFTYQWNPANIVRNPTIASPFATPLTTTIFGVAANIGSCQARAQVTVTTVPYPLVNAGSDSILCFGTTGKLTGTTNGNSFRWSPAAFVSNSTILNPEARPTQTTAFVLSATDTKGCPKPTTDTALYVVLPVINASAGNDTSVVVGQQLQLTATGGQRYVWTPPFNLSSPTIANPIAVFSDGTEGERYTVFVYNEAGCLDTASINIKVFNSLPNIFVPTAFTPNNDGRNDVLRPIAAGIKSMEFFRVFNRWGQLLFTTGQPGKGWDGTINGKPQASGTFVWMIKAVDYNNKPFIQKGTATLIR